MYNAGRLARKHRSVKKAAICEKMPEPVGSSPVCGARLPSAVATYARAVMLDGERLSPELVLVSPDLAERARALLPDRPGYGGQSTDTAAMSSTRSASLELPNLALQEHAHDLSRERLDELAALVDRIATDWQQVERRLAQVERAVARMEAALAIASLPPAPWLDAQPEAEDERQLPPGVPEPETKTRTGFAGTIVVVASVVAAMIAVELLPSFGDRPRLAVVSEGAPTTVEPAGAPGAATGERSPGFPTTTEAPVPPRTTEARRTTTAAPPAEPPTTATETSAATTTERPRTTGTTPPPPRVSAPTTTSANSFEPARVFLWPAVADATLYDVTFLRNGRSFYSARVSKPRLALPEKIQFRPGSYRWIVRPGAAGEALGSPIVDSTFTIERS